MTNEKSIAQVVEEGERLLAIQSPGEWTAFEDSVYQGSIPIAHCTVLFRNEEQPCATAALIVHLHNHFPALLAAAKEAEGLKRAEEARQRFAESDKCPDCYHGAIVTAAPLDGEGSCDEEACPACCGTGSQAVAKCIAEVFQDRLDDELSSLRQSLTDAEKERDELRQTCDNLQQLCELQRETVAPMLKLTIAEIRADAIKEAAKVAERICLRHDEIAKENGPYSLACDDKQSETAAEISLAILALLLQDVPSSSAAAAEVEK